MNEKLAVIGSKKSIRDLAAFQGGAEKLVMLKPKLLALIASELRQFNLSVPATLSAAIRIWTSYVEDKKMFADAFTAAGFDAAAVEDFPMRTAVLWYTDTQLGQMLAPRQGLSEEILLQAKPLHAKLARAARYLFEDDARLGPVVADIRQGAGHLDTAGDLNRYAVLFEEHWDLAEGRCDVTLEDLASAKHLSTLILEGLTAAPEGDIAEWKDLRNRAGEYLRRGAEDIRAAAAYLFREDPDALSRYPSLHAPRGPARKHKSESAEEQPQEAPEPEGETTESTV